MELAKQSELSFRQVRLYNPALLSKYLNIRYQVFICEMKRRIIIGEFHFNDFLAKHFILQDSRGVVIGTARLIYKDENTAQIGRVAVRKDYRNQGYGGMIINKLLAIVKKDSRVSIVSLLSEDDKIKFYKRLGFIANGRIFTYAEPLTHMVITIKSKI